MNEKPLVVRELTVAYPRTKHKAVEEVSFEVSPGKITALIGPNGSGKTTIIKAILGLLEFEGEIKIFGKKVESEYGNIGYVPQRFSFDNTFPISVEEFVRLALVRCEDSMKERRVRVRRALKQAGIEGVEKQELAKLSGGQLQKVLLARALVHSPKLILLDEPEAGVDVRGEQVFYELLEKLVSSEGVTVLLASHELDVVYAYADEVVCVNKRLVCTGVPREVLDQETFVKLYGHGLKFYGHDKERHGEHHGE